MVAAIADGIGGAKGGRVAAETAVRGFLDGFCDLPETMEVQRASARIVTSLNGWINSMGRQDPALTGLGCTLTALVLRGRVAHVLHVGDTRAYRLSGNRLTCLTTDHVRQEGPGRSHTLLRALGVEAEVRLDYATQPVALHDRFLLCSDGVHGFLSDERIAEILRERSAPEDTANALVAAALDAGSTDNCTALVLDVVALPAAGSGDISAAIMRLPIIPVPVGGEAIDGFLLKALFSDGRYTPALWRRGRGRGRHLRAEISQAADRQRRSLSRGVRARGLGRRAGAQPVDRARHRIAAGTPDRLYTVMPLYVGELWRRGCRAARASGWRKGGRSRSRWRARSRRCTAPGSSTATSSQTM